MTACAAGRDVDPGQAGPAADGRRHRRRRRPRRRRHPPRRRHHDRQLDRPVDDGRTAGRHRRIRGPAAAGGERRRGGRTGVAPVRPDRRASRRRGCWRRPRHPPRSTTSRCSAARPCGSLGVTIDFAPVVDVTTESDDEVIGDRSFGSDPAQVTEFAGAYAQGLRDAGLLPVLKHFPGHGHASGDSHQGGVVTPPLADLQANDLVPYRTLTTQAPVAVMVGHMQVPGLTGSDPASLSPAAYGLLRSGGYGGPRVRRAGVHRRPVQHGRHQPALRRRRRGAARRCRPAPTSRCGSPPTRCPRCWTGWRRRWRPVN